MRNALLILPLLLSSGCVTLSARPTTAVKELYVELLGEATERGLVAFPLKPEDEASCYVTMRRMTTGQHDDASGLVALLETYIEQTEAGAGEGERNDEEVTVDAHDLGARLGGDGAPSPDATEPPPPGDAPPPVDVAEAASSREAPSMLLTRLVPESITASSCYLGHTSFLRDDGSPIPAIVHHLRLLIANRESFPLRIAADDLSAFGAERIPDADAAEGAADSVFVPFERLGELTEHGRMREQLTVQPGEHTVLESFFVTDRVFPFLRVRWGIEAAAEEPADDDGASPTRFRWQFEVRLRRRYVVQVAPLDAVEAQVASGRPVPAARPNLLTSDTSREGRMAPMPLGTR